MEEFDQNKVDRNGSGDGWKRWATGLAPASKVYASSATSAGENTMGEWVSIDERLPDRLHDYLCAIRFVPFGFGYAICTFLGDEGIDGVYGFSVPDSTRRLGGTITHWMPIEPPRN